MKAKIAFVIESLENRGAQHLMVEWAIRMKEKGLDVHLISLRDDHSSLIARIEAAKLPLKFCHKEKRLDLGLLKRLTQHICQEQFDVVHTHVFTANLWGQIAAHLCHVPITLMHEHGYFSLGSPFRRRVTGLLSRRVDRVLVVSEHLKKELQAKACISAEKITVLQNGVDWQRLDALSETETLRNGKLVVGVVGALEERKDPFTFLDAAEEILKKNKNVEFWWVGDGPLFPAVNNYIEAKRLGSLVRLWGNQKNVSIFLKQMDVFVLPSKTEGVPLSLLEAMGAGLPVVATRVGENDRILNNGKIGLLVDAENAAELASSIGKLLKNTELRKKLGEQSRFFARKEFSLEASANALYTLYEELLEEKRT